MHTRVRLNIKGGGKVLVLDSFYPIDSKRDCHEFDSFWPINSKRNCHELGREREREEIVMNLKREGQFPVMHTPHTQDL